MRDARLLKRIHRVRTVQLTLARAEEVRATGGVENERQLVSRIADLAAAVAPASGSAAALMARAHYAERLHQSATAASTRLMRAEAELARTVEAARAARRDQAAAEKLRDRATAEAALAEMRALAEAPPATRRTR
jgi:hypothetical protein